MQQEYQDCHSKSRNPKNTDKSVRIDVKLAETDDNNKDMSPLKTPWFFTCGSLNRSMSTSKDSLTKLGVPENSRREAYVITNFYLYNQNNSRKDIESLCLKLLT